MRGSAHVGLHLLTAMASTVVSIVVWLRIVAAITITPSATSIRVDEDLGCTFDGLASKHVVAGVWLPFVHHAVVCLRH